MIRRIAAGLLVLSVVMGACNSPQQVDNTSSVQVVNPQEYKSKDTANMRIVHDFIKACPNYYIATIDEGAQPRVRPFGTIHIFEDKLYIQTGHKKRIAEQLRQHPKIEICAFNGSAWIRLQAVTVEDTRVSAKASMLDAYPSLKSMYSAEDDNTAVYFLVDARAYISSFSEAEQALEF